MRMMMMMMMMLTMTMLQLLLLLVLLLLLLIKLAVQWGYLDESINRPSELLHLGWFQADDDKNRGPSGSLFWVTISI